MPATCRHPCVLQSAVLRKARGGMSHLRHPIVAGWWGAMAAALATLYGKEERTGKTGHAESPRWWTRCGAVHRCGSAQCRPTSARLLGALGMCVLLHTLAKTGRSWTVAPVAAAAEAGIGTVALAASLPTPEMTYVTACWECSHVTGPAVRDEQRRDGGRHCHR